MWYFLKKQKFKKHNLISNTVFLIWYIEVYISVNASIVNSIYASLIETYFLTNENHYGGPLRYTGTQLWSLINVKSFMNLNISIMLIETLFFLKKIRYCKKI